MNGGRGHPCSSGDGKLSRDHPVLFLDGGPSLWDPQFQGVVAVGPPNSATWEAQQEPPGLLLDG